jgi:ABC-type branched-subunit amino acid transport system substrate-binding protein
MHLTRILIILGYIIGIGLSDSVSCAETKPIIIGYLLDLSGKGAFMGQQSRAGALLAKEELKTEGLNLEIIFEDHRTEAKNGSTATLKLINLDHVSAVLCDLSPPCIAAAPIVSKAGIPFIYQAPISSIVEKYSNSYKNFLDYEAGCRKIAEIWENQGITQIAHLKVNSEFGDLCLKGSKEIFSEQQVFEYDTSTDLKSVLLKFKALGIQAVFQTGYEADYINRFRSAYEIRLNMLSAMPEPLLTKAVIKSVPASALNGTVTFGFPHLDAGFEQKLRNHNLYYSSTSLESAAIAYMNVRQLALAIKACPDLDLICQQKQIEVSAEASDNLSFLGWKNRVALYKMAIRSWQSGHLVDF